MIWHRDPFRFSKNLYISDGTEVSPGWSFGIKGADWTTSVVRCFARDTHTNRKTSTVPTSLSSILLCSYVTREFWTNSQNLTFLPHPRVWITARSVSVDNWEVLFNFTQNKFILQEPLWDWTKALRHKQILFKEAICTCGQGYCWNWWQHLWETCI